MTVENPLSRRRVSASVSYLETGTENETPRVSDRDFPRVIWILWYQGWKNAPELVKRCLHFRKIWDATPKVRPAGIIEIGGAHKFYEPLSSSVRREIDEALQPVYKLNWRLNLTKVVPGTFLDHLLKIIPEEPLLTEAGYSMIKE